MDDYPAHSLDHDIPLLAVLGLPISPRQESSLDPSLKEQAILVRSELPTLEGEQATTVLRYIEQGDASGPPWNGKSRSRRYKFRVKAAGRTYLLPPRRASLPEDFEVSQSPAALHSPFSPLSPSCHLYPDGIIDPGWLRKHQDLVPSVLLCFYSLTSDPTLATLHDNKTKTDINALRSALVQSGYKSRLSVVILSDQPKASGDGTRERLENIRKGCGLDPKAFFFVPSQESGDELERVLDNVLATVYTQAVEYYRDLGRHSRKKRGRGFAPQPTVPPTSGTSQTLSLPGWNVRYDFKSAIFAEFREEMDTALKSFEQAYETLLGAEVMDSMPSWIPRWDEARLLADMIAIRSLRCLLWNGQNSAAVRRWQFHRDRMSDLIDRRGRGTNNYGWEAWDSRWAVVMANLIERVQVPGLDPETGNLFLQPEKGVVGERLPPWEFLHHTGYWYRSAARHLHARRVLAYKIPEDDRRPPDFSPASKVASRPFTYDTYMCPDPHEELPLNGAIGVDHSKLIIGRLMAARTEFEKRRQMRLAGELALECAREFASIKDWQNVFDLLVSQWEAASFKAEGWLGATEDLGWILRAAASNLGRGDIVVAIDWELLDQRYTRRQNWHYDLSRALDGPSVDEIISVNLTEDSTPSFLSASFIFQNDEGKAGETCRGQLAISSNAFLGSAPIVFEAIQLEFEGSIKPVILAHDTNLAGPVPKPGGSVLSLISLQEDAGDSDDKSKLRGSSNLTIYPVATTVLDMAIPLREPGNAQASRLDLRLSCQGFSLRQTMRLVDAGTPSTWFLSSVARKRVARTKPRSVNILPRPPKLEIRLRDLSGQYYTNESIDLHFEIVNAEEADANVKLDAAMFGEEPQGFKLLVADEEIDTAPPHGEESALVSIPLGLISTTKSIAASLHVDPIALSTSYEFTLRASYHLITDPATPVTQSTVFKLTLVNPFEANYDLLPRLHPDPWPSVFDYEGVFNYSGEDSGSSHPHGLSQTWTLVTRYASFASEVLTVVGLDVAIQPAHGVRCRSHRRSTLPADGLQIKPKTIEEALFDVDAEKMSLDDMSSTALDVSFIIKWQRRDTASPSTNTTLLPVPRLGIFGTEPRVLASASYSKDPHALVFLDIVIENASNHFLTFGLAMEPSEDFAFSGAKQTTLNLLPVSRRTVTYRLLPLVRGAWIKPNLVVKDKYFQKVLRIVPTEGMKLDKDGFLVWVPPEDDDGEGAEQGP